MTGLEQLRKEREEQFDLIAPAEKRWEQADEAERTAREEIHQIRMRFYRTCEAIKILEGKT